MDQLSKEALKALQKNLQEQQKLSGTIYRNLGQQTHPHPAESNKLRDQRPVKKVAEVYS